VDYHRYILWILSILKTHFTNVMTLRATPYLWFGFRAPSSNNTINVIICEDVLTI
jgi:hypothetical protein